MAWNSNEALHVGLLDYVWPGGGCLEEDCWGLPWDCWGLLGTAGDCPGTAWMEDGGLHGSRTAGKMVSIDWTGFRMEKWKNGKIRNTKYEIRNKK